MLTYATQQCDKPGMQEFQAFYENNLVRVYRFVFKSLKNREEAEDLTSQIFLKALRYLDPERNAQSARSWLFKIAHTTIADYWRIHYRTLTSSLDVRMEAGWEGPTGEEILETNERAAEQVYNLLQELPERYREVLSYRFLLNLSIRETAETMDVSEANVKILQFRAIKRAINLANSITKV
ncbi:MAG TPA: RNA polymerase sigma factor [Ktedonobacteraceae bacterium]|jgi:RNA polymerase sigma-70 factor (ECF subfamily)|nr:RNA polymerase sigma factor [Ktedonobacteraceae bacterium]